MHPGEPWRVHVWPVGGGQYTGLLALPAAARSPFTVSAATAVGLALLLGCTGKSAQIPLYVWLPDAMAGPTPVSALIHAATMVTAGVYLICRLSFVFVLSPFTMMVIAIVGAATALLAATIALVQNDIKKVLAYSTVSQLGFMFLGVGVGAFAAGFFHVFTHAFFKACLFLCAGSVIHAMHARIHDDDKAQDIRQHGRPAQVAAAHALDVRCGDARPSSASRSRAASSRRTRSSTARTSITTINPMAGSPMLRQLHALRAAGRGSDRCSTGVAVARRDDDGVLHVPPLLSDLLGRLQGLDGRAARRSSRSTELAHGARTTSPRRGPLDARATRRTSRPGR